MRIPYALLIGSVLAEATSLDQFEQPDFDIKKALLENGKRNDSACSDRCAKACHTLLAVFGDAKVEMQGETAYSTVIDYFWADQQKEASPRCVFKPETALDVSTQILISRYTGCPFAVRSGGHAPFKGASSTNGGITTTFEKMKGIALSQDKKIVSVEPGNLWLDVYTSLAKENLAVVGGRVSDIGVGGLTTGGGLSFFSNQYGWACDNVASFEVVTASGRIVTASPTSYPDLYKGLRGGGNNLAIVTRFDLQTFAHGPQMFGGTRQFMNTSFPGAIDAFVNLGNNAAADPKAAQFLSTGLAGPGLEVAIAQLEHADPIANASIFEEWRNVPAFNDTTAITTLTTLTEQLRFSTPKGFRQTGWTASSKLDKAMVEFGFKVTFEEFGKIQDVAGVLAATTFQVITVPQLNRMQNNGGNTLGLSPSDGPILLVDLSVRWSKVEDDARIMKACANVIKRMLAEAKRTGKEQSYLYMNYASEYQDVIANYGKSASTLRNVARKYDPTKFFQTNQPGYFKLQGPPNVNWP
ncbi:FAD-binding domain-containing protein [Plenodomus tracheiphilus IPT5]|uniref:FAD-binding domain-containing protein n=1 Tax=Plenodomus tracheiphilus IPT5 TaxID=1408161 RepID=A0A6A7B5N2_9PLEO|nr:FAD-binding domain-containing protein [Plenodomus tracheiphilus IPT5]